MLVPEALKVLGGAVDDMDPTADDAGLVAQFLGALTKEDPAALAAQIRDKGFAGALLEGLAKDGNPHSILTSLLEFLSPLMNRLFEKEVAPELRNFAENGLPPALAGATP